MSAQGEDLSKMTVDEVIRRWPETAKVFRQYALDCLGCAIAPLCEITAVAEIYNLPQQQFMADLRKAIESSK